jgi:hypothetical protein
MNDEFNLEALFEITIGNFQDLDEIFNDSFFSIINSNHIAEEPDVNITLQQLNENEENCKEKQNYEEYKQILDMYINMWPTDKKINLQNLLQIAEIKYNKKYII